jgi:HlyD family secretion protein
MTAILGIRLTAALCALALVGYSNDPGSTYQGWVEAELVFVGPDEAGRLEELFVREGESVAAGARLFTLDAEIQKAQMQDAQASADEARARLARLEAAQQRPEEIAVLEAQEARAEASLAQSTAEFERQKALLVKNVGSQAQFDAARGAHDRDRAALEEVRRQIALAKMPARVEDIAAARDASVAAQARLAAAQTRLERRRIASPAAGIVQQVYYRRGEVVPAARPVVSLLPPANIKVRFFVPQPVLPRIGLGTAISVHCDGCGEDIVARIDFVARTAEFTPPVIYTLEERAKLVFLVEARPEQPERLRVGQPVSVALASRETGT